jgi:hypothetical protein
MSLSLIMIASNSVGLRSCRFDDDSTAFAMRWHSVGVHAGVIQRIFCFTEQMVLTMQVSA